MDEPTVPINAVCLWLHGAGEKGQDWRARLREGVSRLRLTWVDFDFPDAPENAPSWFDVALPVWDGAKEFAGIDAAVAAVHAKLKAAEAKGIAPSRIVLGGHGPGAALALLAGRTYPAQIGGIASLAGWVLRPTVESSAARPRILLCHGDDDDEVPYDLYTHALSYFRSRHYAVTYQEYEGYSHKQVAEELTVLAAPKNFITDTLPPVVDKASRAAQLEMAAAAKAEKAAEAKAKAPRCRLDAATEKSSLAAAEKLVAAAADAETETFQAAAAEATEAQIRAAVAAADISDAAESAVGTKRCELLSLQEDDKGEAFQAVLSLNGITSMQEVDLAVGETSFEVRLAGAPTGGKPALVVPLPKRIDADALGSAKFSKKTGQLKLSLRLA